MDDAAWDAVEAVVVSGGGALPDGMVHDVGMPGWQALLDLIHRRSWTSELRSDGDPRPVPGSAIELFATGLYGTIAVWITPSVQINVFANGQESVCFDFDIRELAGGGLRQVAAFVRDLGRALDEPVELAHEGDSAAVFLVYDPASDSFDTPG
ncbi:MAG: hypothetical protein ACTHN0_14990 [Aquihabitans sp.]